MQKKLTPSEAKVSIFRYCVYQERCHQEVKNKLYEYGLRSSEVDELLTDLITEGFLNEERFARAYSGGKFRIKQWGRLKIIRELESKGLTANCIKAGLTEIGDEDYLKCLRALLGKKSALLTEQNEFARRDKLSRFAIQKGFEPDLVWSVIKTDGL